MKPVDPRVLPHLAPARGSLAGVVAGSLAGGGLLVAQAFAVSMLVVALFDSGTGPAATTAATWLAVITALRAVASWATDALSARAASTVGTAMRRSLLAAALRMGPLALSRRRVGEIALLSTRGVAAIEPYLTRYLPTLVVAATLPPLTVAAIASQDLLSALVVVLTLPLVPVFAVLIGLATRDRADRQWRLLARLSGHFLDVVRGLPTLVAYRRAEAQSASIRTVTHRYRQATRETLRLGFASSAALELIATISVALVAVIVGVRLAAGSLDLGTALVVLLLAPEAYWPLRRVGAEFHAAAEGTATFTAVDGFITHAPAGRAAVAVRLPDPVAGIVLDGITAGYAGREQPVLVDLSAEVPGRGVTVVSGPSGAGKSTLLSVLTGDLPTTAGAVLVGGVPLSAELAPVWQAQVAWVPQRPWIAAATIAENVRLANPSAGEAEVWQALERVALGELVAALPQGLDTVVGEDGAGLSAGQRARLALARAVVAARPVVLLDEPSAHLDAETEQVIVDTIRWLGQRSAVVVVAHRPGILEIADHVIPVPPPAVPPAAVPPPAESSLPVARTVSSCGPSRHLRSSAPQEVTTRTTGSDGSVLLGTVLGVLATASGVALTATAGWLIAKAAEQPPVLTLMVAIVGVRTFGLARPALRYAERLVSHDAALAMLADRRADVFDLLVPLTPGRLSRQRGDLLSSVVDDVDSLLDRQLRVRMPVATAACVGVLATAFTLWQLPSAGLVVAAFTAVAGVVAYGLARAGVRRAEGTFVARRAELSALVVQTLQGVGDLVMWQGAPRRLDAVDALGSALGKASRASARAVAAGRALVVVAAGLTVVAVSWLGAGAVADGALSKPMLALLVLLPLALAEVLAPLADAGALSVRTAAADERLARLAALSPAVTSPEVPQPADLTAPDVAADRLSAGWGATAAFDEVSFRLEPGARIGVVGPSGCGKSTLAAVLMRFLDPMSGRVSLAGVPLPALALDDVRRTVGLVDDDPHVFGSTLRENLRLARPDCTDADLREALEQAALGAWVDALPDGLDTLIGDGAAHVSGGERARLGLARAVLADQPVLVLDEPTAHLDAATATQVTEDLLATQGRTVVWITHGTVGLDRMDSVLEMTEAPPHLPDVMLGGRRSSHLA